MFRFRENSRRFSLPPRYEILLAWLIAALGVLTAMRFTALPLVK